MLVYTINSHKKLVCAPGWKYILTEKYGNKFNFPVGKCYHFKETWQYESCENEYEYCIPFWKKPNEVDISMGGFSMKYSQDGKYSLIGGPGENQERGAVKSHQIKQEHIFDKRKDGLWVQYFGFSLTTANFNEYGSFTAGIPNYHPNQQGYTGRVEVFSVVDFARKNALNFGETTSCDGVILEEHPQSGSKFGYIVEGINVDNKGMDELFVGAPLYSEFVMKRVVSPDTGRVFVYHVTTEKICGPIVVLTGAASDPSLRKLVAYARFGTAISSAGDLNHDGYKDVAIGAPYEDEYTGAVYIYNGGTDGVKDVFSQRITGRIVASNTPGLNIQTFGWHINGEYDVDKNGFTDLAIGAYKNDVAIVLRTRPVVNVTMDIRLFPSIIPLNGTPGSACGDAPCLRLMVCFSYIVENPASVGVAEKLTLQYDVELDMLAKENNDPVRVKFQNDSNAGRKNITLVRSVDLLQEECRNLTIVVKKNGESHLPRDIWTPLRFAINFTLLQTASDFSVLDPVLKPEVQSSKIVEANFDTKCENKTCQSDLELAVEVRFLNFNNWAPLDDKTKLVVGDAKELELTAKVTNRLDYAFKVNLVAQVHAPLKSTNSMHGVVGALCQDDQAQGVIRSNVTCTANGKLDAKHYIQIVFKYDVSEKWLLPSVQDIAKMPQEITILAQAIQANIDINQTNNIFNTTIPVRLEATVEIIANKSVSEQVEYKNDPESDRTLYIQHRYHLINHGPSPLINATIIITVPIANKDKTLAVIVNASAGCVIPLQDSDKILMSSTTVGPIERTTRFIDLPLPNQQRRKRDNSHGIQTLELTVQDPSKLDLTCENYQCHQVTCNVGAVKGEEKKTVDVNINIAEKHIPSDKSLREITYISRAEVSDPYVNFKIPEKLFALKRTRLVISQISIPPNDINIWIIIGSVAGGILLLIIVIIILWKCGFFKRKKHQELQQYKRESLYKRKSIKMSTLGSDEKPQAQT
ncbi:hypothetical protein CHS0354_012167 [Potamilus streckersoni]|uniref:Integrin alpha-2 domain-containing protein n=1 Tax=Potamilus streckersoni TaxID=2493646 RepID=A0AAE0SAH0_9BIVA|nr:hypothetical protein CHS0354_012167 [Potamilus streckersoni]